MTSATTCEGVPIIPWVSNTGRARTQVPRRPPAAPPPLALHTTTQPQLFPTHTHPPPRQTVRLSALETFYLVHAVHCLTLYQEARRRNSSPPLPGASLRAPLALLTPLGPAAPRRCIRQVEEDADDGSAPGAHSAEALALWASDETLSAVRRWRCGADAPCDARFPACPTRPRQPQGCFETRPPSPAAAPQRRDWGGA